jgi:two-component system, NtrC family, response regulator AtoC
MEHLLVGNHPSILKIRELVKLVSNAAFNVLIAGETGTGKEVVARLLHNASDRRKERFIKVNCAALPFTLLESELFGYEKGAFTGADRPKPGKFELASNGVMFLDEIGDMPLMLQSKLLEILQSGKFVRLGGTSEVKVNTWVISSTNHDLQADIKSSLFREDLFYRLNIIQILMPPLRERREDIPFLARHFITRYRREFNYSDEFQVPVELERLFWSYHWPGNVRELANVIMRIMVGDDAEAIYSELVVNMRNEGISPNDELEKKVLEPKPSPEGESPSAPSLLEIKERATKTVERQAILYALTNTGWNKRAAARMLKISHKALYYKMEDFGIDKAKAKEW